MWREGRYYTTAIAQRLSLGLKNKGNFLLLLLECSVCVGSIFLSTLYFIVCAIKLTFFFLFIFFSPHSQVARALVLTALVPYPTMYYYFFNLTFYFFKSSVCVCVRVCGGSKKGQD